MIVLVTGASSGFGAAMARRFVQQGHRVIAAARRSGADAVMLSPVFPTRSHPGSRALGPLRFRLMAARAGIPVIALGGMNRITAKRLAWPRQAAIDGLS